MSYSKVYLTCILLVLTLLCFQSSSKASHILDSEISTSTSTVSASIKAKDLALLDQTKLLFSINRTCTLPCWWGFQPRKATIAEIQAVIGRKLGRKLSNPFERSDGLIDYYFDLYLHSLTDESLEIGFIVKDIELVSTRIMLVEPNKWLERQDFELTWLLKKLGKPTEIYVGVNPATRLFALYIFYKEKGVAAEYIVNFQDQQFTESNDPIQLCPRPEQIDSIKLWLSANADDLTAEQINGNIPQIEPSNTPTLQAITGKTVDAFIKYFQENPDGCINALSYSELSRQDYLR